MSKYQIVFFDSSKATKTHSFFISPAHCVFIALLFVALIVALIVTQLVIKSIKHEIYAIENRFSDHSSDDTSVKYTENILNKVIMALQQDDAFIHEVYDEAPIIRLHYTLEDITDNFTDHTMFMNLFTLNRHTGYKNMGAMFRLVSALSEEMNARLSKYAELEEFLNEQYVIYRHTPSIWPSPTERMTSPFGFRRSPFTGIPSYHEGTDFSANTGTSIMAAADGVIVFAGTRTGYGYLVTIDHGFGYMTRYAHNSKLLVKSGDRVKRGDIISLSGSTGRSAGPHLHYEVLYNGTPVNSRKFLPNEGRPVN